MKKKLSRALALLCAFALAVIALPPVVPAFAEGATSGDCGAEGSNVQWNFDAATGTLTLSGTGKMADYEYNLLENTGPWSSCADAVKTISIGLGVTSIGQWAFANCGNLISVTIPATMTDIGEEAFCNCKSLTNLTIPTSVTSIGAFACWSCTSLTSVTIPSSVTSIKESTFAGCSGLKSVTIPNSVTSIEKAAFEVCDSLTDVTIPASVTSMGKEVFQYCRGLKSVTILNGVTAIEQAAFNGCTSLTNVTIPDSVTSIGGAAFLGCHSLASVRIPASVTSVEGQAFDNCTGLTSVTIPDSVTSIGMWAFSNCTSLKTITFEGNAPEVNSTISTIFSDVTATAYYPAGDATWTEAVRQNYGGTITWKEYNVKAPVSEPEVKSEVDTSKLTAEEQGNVQSVADSLQSAPQPSAKLSNIYKGAALAEGETLTLQYTLTAVEQSGNKIHSFTTDIKPVRKKADGSIEEIDGKALSLENGFTFRIPVPKAMAESANRAVVLHNGERLGMYEIRDKNSASPYVEVTTTSFSPFTVQVAAAMPGDANQDGDVDIFDLAAVKSYILDNSTKIDTAAADMTGDGEIDIFDLMQIKRYILNKGQA